MRGLEGQKKHTHNWHPHTRNTETLTLDFECHGDINLHHDLYTLFSPHNNPDLRESPYMTTTTGSMYRGDNLLGRIVRISRFANLAVYELDGRMDGGWKWIVIQPRNLTNRYQKLQILQGVHLFQTIILGIHVSFRECNSHKGRFSS